MNLYTRRSKHCAKQTVLDEDLVRTLRRRAKAGEVVREMAAELGVGYSTVLNAINGNSWGWVTEEVEPELVSTTDELAEHARASAEKLAAMLKEPEMHAPTVNKYLDPTPAPQPATPHMSDEELKQQEEARTQRIKEHEAQKAKKLAEYLERKKAGEFAGVVGELNDLKGDEK